MAKPEIFCTSFCNQGHRLSTGRPVAHECYVLPPASLRAEREGDFALAIELLRTMDRRSVKGRKA